MDQDFSTIEFMIENADIGGARKRMDELLKYNEKNANAHALLS